MKILKQRNKTKYKKNNIIFEVKNSLLELEKTFKELRHIVSLFPPKTLLESM